MSFFFALLTFCHFFSYSKFYMIFWRGFKAAGIKTTKAPSFGATATAYSFLQPSCLSCWWPPTLTRSGPGGWPWRRHRTGSPWSLPPSSLQLSLLSFGGHSCWDHHLSTCNCLLQPLLSVSLGQWALPSAVAAMATDLDHWKAIVVVELQEPDPLLWTNRQRALQRPRLGQNLRDKWQSKQLRNTSQQHWGHGLKHCY